METWVRPNTRVLALGAAAGLAVALLGGALSAWAWTVNAGWLLVAACFLAAAAGAVVAWRFVRACRRPRLAYDGERLVVMLGEPPETPPIEIVECFFVGQGPAAVRGPDGRDSESMNIIVRLAERADDWQRREVSAKLGQWCEGYIVVRGSWCEPITQELIRRLNHRLSEAQAERKAAARQEVA